MLFLQNLLSPLTVHLTCVTKNPRWEEGEQAVHEAFKLLLMAGTPLKRLFLWMSIHIDACP